MSSEHDKREDLFSDMELPDMEKSWEQMKQKLQQEKDRRKPVVHWPRKAVILMLLICMGAGAGWWLLSDQDEEKSKEKSATITQDQLPVSVSLPKDSETKPTARTEDKNSNTNGVNLPTANAPDNTKKLRDQKSNDIAASPTHAVATAITRLSTKTNTNRSTNRNDKTRIETLVTEHVTAKSSTRIISSSAEDDQLPATTPSALVKETQLTTDSSASITTVTATPSLTETTDTTTKKTQPVITANAAKPGQQKPKKPMQFSLGLGLQQQVPLGGQSGVGYNYSGRSNTFSDHLPSLYMRMEKPKKWFVDAEFHYGSPQLLKGFSYSRQTTLQDSGTVLSTNSLNIEKTYYHRIPLSLNVYLKPRWSLGAGMEYSLFYGAISRKTTTNKNLLSGLTSSSSEMVFLKQFNDSFLYKSQVRLIFQSMYQWKRFSLGLRYSADLEPYIRFTTPEGVIKDRKSKALQMLVRYRLVKK